MKNNKKAIIAISCIMVCVIAVIAIILAVALKDDKSITLKDAEGADFATVSWDGYDITYTVNNDYEKEYAVYVTDELKKFLVAESDVKESKINDYIFDKVSYVNTNYKPEIQATLKDAYDKNEQLKSASCAMAVTDLNGRLVAVFSGGAEENLSLNKTYAGSTLKPLSVYAPAIDSGEFNWSSTFVDEPVKQIEESDGRLTDWPVNSDGRYTHKNVPLSNALALSTNTVAVKLLQEVGVKKSVEILENSYGINVDFEKNMMETSGEDEVLGNIALGYLYDGVTVVDMAGYYQVFATEGKYTPPTAVDEIFDENGSLYKSEYAFKRVMDFDTANIMNKMLRRVVDMGTGKGARLNEVAVGGKTGTTTDNADNWFVGFTPEYSCAVWHSKIEDGNICPQVFKSAFDNIESTQKVFEDRGNFEARLYCEKSGLLRGEKCIYCNKGYYLVTQKLAQCKECK